jgi:predicted nucleotidyltransferase
LYRFPFSFLAQLPLVRKLLKEHKIKKAYAFGSVVNDKFNNESDIDLLINFEEGLDPLERGELIWSLQFALEDNLHREIDLLQESSLKNPYFIEEVNEKKQLIYEA